MNVSCPAARLTRRCDTHLGIRVRYGVVDRAAPCLAACAAADGIGTVAARRQASAQSRHAFAQAAIWASPTSWSQDAAHASHPSRLTLVSTLVGVLIMFGVVALAH